MVLQAISLWDSLLCFLEVLDVHFPEKFVSREDYFEVILGFHIFDFAYGSPFAVEV
jgi:hypothetical protein